MHDRAVFKTPEAKQLNRHPLMVAKMDRDTHADYHAEFYGLRKPPHQMIVMAGLDCLDALEEETQPVTVVEMLAYCMGTLSLKEYGRDIERSAQNMEQLLLNQIPYLLKGKADYGS